MKWTVLRKADAESDVAELWVNAMDNAAANRIDMQLRRDPLTTGESRAEDDRVHVEEPLGILFTVDSMDRKVQVVRVWRIF